MTDEPSTPVGTDPETKPEGESGNPIAAPAKEAVEDALKDVLTPEDRMNRAFTKFAADNPQFPATMKGNAQGHYVLGACGAQVTLNCNDKGNPLRCAPVTDEEASKFIDDGIALLRETLTTTVKHMIRILDLDLG